jgi:hypothetical protein
VATPSRIGTSVALAALAGALATPALAAPRIVPGHRIGPVAIGAERAVVEGTIGPGTVVARTPSPLAPGNRNIDQVVVAYPAWAVVATFPTDEASAATRRVATRSARYRTSAGAGVGSSRRALRAAHPRVACAGVVCRLGRRVPGAVVTRFTLVAGRVARVEVLRLPPRP